MDARLRALERAAALGDPEAEALLEQERLRAGLRHQYEPHEISYIGRTCCSIARLRWGWCVLPRSRTPRSRAHRPPERFDLVDEWRSGPNGTFAPGRVFAVVPESWLRSQTVRLGDAFVAEWIRISVERRTYDERIIREEQQAHDAAWRQIVDALEHGPHVMPARRLAPSVRRQLADDPAFRINDVGSRVVIGRADDGARYDQVLAEARARSTRARRAAETRRGRITTATPQARPRPSSSRPSGSETSRPRSPTDEATALRWGEALDRLRGVVGSGEGLAIGSTPELRRITGLPSTAATSELLAAIRDGQVPGAGDILVTRVRGEWFVTPSGPRR